MNSRNEILKELKELQSSLPIENNQPVFDVPVGYFDNFAASVLARIKSEEISSADELSEISPLLAGISKKMPFSVPDDYFTKMAEKAVELTSEESMPSLLSQTSKLTPYQVPAGYFDQLPQQVLSRVSKPQAKVIPMPVQHISSSKSWMRYAAAAIVIGIVAISGIFFFKSNNSTDSLAAQPENWVAKKVKDVSREELNEFLEVYSVTAQKNTSKNTEAPKGLKGISKKEIDAFLNEIPTDDIDLSTYN